MSVTSISLPLLIYSCEYNKKNDNDQNSYNDQNDDSQNNSDQNSDNNHNNQISDQEKLDSFLNLDNKPKPVLSTNINKSQILASKIKKEDFIITKKYQDISLEIDSLQVININQIEIKIKASLNKISGFYFYIEKDFKEPISYFDPSISFKWKTNDDLLKYSFLDKQNKIDKNALFIPKTQANKLVSTINIEDIKNNFFSLNNQCEKPQIEIIDYSDLKQKITIKNLENNLTKDLNLSSIKIRLTWSKWGANKTKHSEEKTFYSNTYLALGLNKQNFKNINSPKLEWTEAIKQKLFNLKIYVNNFFENNQINQALFKEYILDKPKIISDKNGGFFQENKETILDTQNYNQDFLIEANLEIKNQKLVINSLLIKNLFNKNKTYPLNLNQSYPITISNFAIIKQASEFIKNLNVVFKENGLTKEQSYTKDVYGKYQFFKWEKNPDNSIFKANYVFNKSQKFDPKQNYIDFDISVEDKNNINNKASKTIRISGFKNFVLRDFLERFGNKNNVEFTDHFNQKIFSVWANGVTPIDYQKEVRLTQTNFQKLESTKQDLTKGYFNISKLDSSSKDNPLCVGAVGANMIYWWLRVNKDNIKKYIELNPNNAFSVDKKNNLSQIKTNYKNQWNEEIFRNWIVNRYGKRALQLDILNAWFFNGDPTIRSYPDTDYSAGFFKNVFTNNFKMDEMNFKYLYDLENAKNFVANSILNGQAGSVSYQAKHGPGHIISIWGADFDKSGNLVAIWTSNSDENESPNTTSSLIGLTRMYLKLDTKDNINRIFISSNKEATTGAWISAIDFMPKSTKEWEKYFLVNKNKQIN